MVYLGQKFQGDGGIDRNVTSHPKTHKCSEYEDTVVVRWSAQA